MANKEALKSMYNDLKMESHGVAYDKFEETMTSNPEARKSVYKDLGFESKGVSYDKYESVLDVKKKDNTSSQSSAGSSVSQKSNQPAPQANTSQNKTVAPQSSVRPADTQKGGTSPLVEGMKQFSQEATPIQQSFKAQPITEIQKDVDAKYNTPERVYENDQRSVKQKDDEIRLQKQKMDNLQHQGAYMSDAGGLRFQKDKTTSKQWVADNQILTNLENERKRLATQANKANASLKPELDKTVRDVTSKDIDKLITTGSSSIGDVKVPNQKAIIDLADKISKEKGLGENSYYSRLLQNAIGGEVSFQIKKPKIEAEFEKQFKQEKGQTYTEFTKSKEKESLELAKNFAELEATKKEASNQIQQTLKAEYEPEFTMVSDSYKQQLQDIETAIKSDVEIEQAVGLKSQELQTKYQTLVNNGSLSVEEATEQLNGELTKYSQNVTNEKYPNVFENAYQNYLDSFNGLNQKLNARYTREFAEVQSKIVERQKAIKSENEALFKKDPKLEEEINALYNKAYGKVLEDEGQKMYSAEQGWGSFGALKNSFMSALGSSLKGTAIYFNSRGLEKVGASMESENLFIPEKMESFSDLLDLSKMMKNTGSLGGSMLPTMIPAIGVTLASGGLGAPSAISMLLGGGISWMGETATMVGNIENETFAKTGSVADANKAGQEMLKGQIDNMYLYTLDMLPFTGVLDDAFRGVRKSIATPVKILSAGTTEVVTETAQEFRQGSQEEAISKYMDVDRANEFMTKENLKSTFLTVSPTFFLGMAGQAKSSFNDYLTKRDVNKDIASLKAKTLLNQEMGTVATNQYLFDMVANQGADFAMVAMEAMYTQGVLNKEQFNESLKAIQQSTKNLAEAKDLGLNDGQAKVYSTIMDEINSVNDELRLADTEFKVNILKDRKKILEKELSNYANTKKTDRVIVQLADDSQFVITSDEVADMMKNPEFAMSVRDGDISVGISDSAKSIEIQDALLANLPTVSNEEVANKVREKTPLNIQEAIVYERNKSEIDSYNKGLESETTQETTPTQTVNENISIEERVKNTLNSIKNKSLFSVGGSFSSALGGSETDSVPIERSEVNGIELVQFANPNSGEVDVIMTGTSDHDHVGYYRVYENGKATNKWSSKFENQSRNKSNFKTMITEAQKALPENHEYTEKDNISTDGLRIFAEQLNRGYELQYDEQGNLITSEVRLNGASLINDLGIEVSDNKFNDIQVNSNEEFESVKKALLPYLQRLNLNESNVKREGNRVVIDLPILLSNKPSSTENKSVSPADTQQEAQTEVEVKEEDVATETEATPTEQEVVTEEVEQTDTEEKVVSDESEISEEEYNDFIDKGNVTKERLTSIAEKVKNQKELSPREQEIFTDKTSEINNIIKSEAKQTTNKPTVSEPKSSEEETVAREEVKVSPTDTKVEQPKKGFTESKDLNKMFADLKSKYGDKKGSALYEVANRLVNPNENTIAEIRSNGVIVKEGDKYTLKPFGNTDASPNKWTLYKGLDVTDQFQKLVEQQPIVDSNSEVDALKDAESAAKALEGVDTFHLVENEGEWKATTKTYRGREIGNWAISNLDKKQQKEYLKIRDEADTYGTKEQAEENLKKLKDFEQKNKEAFERAKQEIDALKEAEERKAEERKKQQNIFDQTEQELNKLSDKEFDKLVELIDEKRRQALEQRFGDRVEKRTLFRTPISESYHKAKADGSNPELVKAVEELLTPSTNEKANDKKPDTESTKEEPKISPADTKVEPTKEEVEKEDRRIKNNRLFDLVRQHDRLPKNSKGSEKKGRPLMKQIQELAKDLGYTIGHGGKNLNIINDKGKLIAKQRGKTDNIEVSAEETEHAKQEVKNNGWLFEWGGDMFDMRLDLGGVITWSEIRKGYADIKAGKDSVPARRLIKAINEQKEKGGYDMVMGSGSMTAREFISQKELQNITFESNKEAITQEVLEKEAKEFDEYIESLSEKERRELLDNIKEFDYHETEKNNEGATSESTDREESKTDDADKEAEKQPIKQPKSEGELAEVIAEVFGLKDKIGQPNKQAKSSAKLIAKSINGLIKAGVFKSEKEFWDAFPTMTTDKPEGISQDQMDKAKGYISLARNAIHAFIGSDVSTPLHEVSHWWLANIEASAKNGNQKAKRISEALDRFAKSPQGKAYWDNEYGGKFNPNNEVFRQELFARGFENYLRDGKAPDNTLKSLFEEVSNWFKEIYQSLTDLGIEINGEMSNVYSYIMTGDDVHINTKPTETEAKIESDINSIIDDIINIDDLPDADDLFQLQESSKNQLVNKVKEYVDKALEKNPDMSYKQFASVLKGNPKTSRLFDVLTNKEIEGLFRDKKGNTDADERGVNPKNTRKNSYTDRAVDQASANISAEMNELKRTRDVTNLSAQKEVADKIFDSMLNSPNPTATFEGFNKLIGITTSSNPNDIAIDSMIMQKIRHYYADTLQDGKMAALWTERIQNVGGGGGVFNAALANDGSPESLANAVREGFKKEQDEALAKKQPNGKTGQEIIDDVKEAIKTTPEEAKSVSQKGVKTKGAKDKAKNKQTTQRRKNVVVVGEKSTADQKKAKQDFKAKAKEYINSLKDKGLLQNAKVDGYKGILSEIIDDIIAMGAKSKEQALNTFISEMEKGGMSEADAISTFNEVWSADNDTEMQDVVAQDLANSIVAKTKSETTVGKKETDPIKILARALLAQVADVIPKETRKGIRDKKPLVKAYEKLAEVISNKGIANDAWVKALESIKETVNANSDLSSAEKAEIIANVEDLVSNFLNEPLPKTVLRQAVKDGIKDLGIEIDKVIENGLTDEIGTGKSLAERIVEQTGLDAISAQEIERAVVDDWNNMLGARKKALAEKELAKSLKQGGKKSKKLLDKIMEAMDKGVLNDDALTNAFAEEFGFAALTPPQIAELNRYMSMLRLDLGIEPKGRILRDFTDFLKSLEPNTAVKVYEYISTFNISSALSGLGTNTQNIPIGTVALTTPTTLLKFIISPKGFISAVRDYSKLNYGAMGFKAGWSALKTGYNQLNDIDEVFEYDPKMRGNLNRYIFNNLGKRLPQLLEKIHATKGKKKPLLRGLAAAGEITKEAFVLSTAIFQGVINLNSAFDPIMSHRLGEIFSYINYYNKELEENKRIGGHKNAGEILDSVREKMGYNQAQQERFIQKARIIAETVAQLGGEMSEAEILRESKFQMISERKNESSKQGYEEVANASMMGKPYGLTGRMLEATQRGLQYNKKPEEALDHVLNFSKFIVNNSLMMFARVATMSVNSIGKAIPLLGSIGSVYTYKPNADGKWKMQRNSKEEIMRGLVGDAMILASYAALMVHTFDWDEEEEKIKLDPDRLIDFTLNIDDITGDYERSDLEKDYTPLAIRFRTSSDKEFGKWQGIKYVLPIVPMVAMLGGLSDRLRYKTSKKDYQDEQGNDLTKPKLKEKYEWSDVKGLAYKDIFNSLSELSFNQTIRTIEDLITALNTKTSEGARDAAINRSSASFLKTYKTLVLPFSTNISRDIMLMTADMLDVEMPKYTKKENLLNRGWVLADFFDSAVEQEGRYVMDRFGNKIPRKSYINEMAYLYNAVPGVEYERQAIADLQKKTVYQITEKYEGIAIPEKQALSSSNFAKVLKNRETPENLKIQVLNEMSKEWGKRIEEKLGDGKWKEMTEDEIYAIMYREKTKAREYIEKVGYETINGKSEKIHLNLYRENPKLYLEIFPEYSNK